LAGHTLQLSKLTTTDNTLHLPETIFTPLPILKKFGVYFDEMEMNARQCAKACFFHVSYPSITPVRGRWQTLVRVL